MLPYWSCLARGFSNLLLNRSSGSSILYRTAQIIRCFCWTYMVFCVCSHFQISVWKFRFSELPIACLDLGKKKGGGGMGRSGESLDSSSVLCKQLYQLVGSENPNMAKAGRDLWVHLTQPLLESWHPEHSARPMSRRLLKASKEETPQPPWAACASDVTHTIKESFPCPSLCSLLLV